MNQNVSFNFFQDEDMFVADKGVFTLVFMTVKVSSLELTFEEISNTQFKHKKLN